MDAESSRIPTIAAVSVAVALLGAFGLDRCADARAREALERNPPFQPPSAAERARAFGPPGSAPAALRALLEDSGAFEPIPAPRPGDWLAAQREPGQTFEAFVEARPNRPAGARSVLYLQPLGAYGGPEVPAVDVLVRWAKGFFTTPVAALPPRDVEGLGVTDRVNKDSGIRQLLTSDLRRFLRERMPADAFAVLGLTMEDLYAGPSWNFAFGEASLTERVGVYSFARYAPAAGGQAAPAELILQRGCKVLAHEACHLYGLHHCVYYRCLMNGSNHLGELDAQPMHLCPVCLRKLQWSAGFDVRERHLRLRDVAQELGFQDEARWLGER